MKQILTIIIFILITNSNFGQDKVIFHEYSPTASSWNILKWNITDTANTIWTLRETIDSNGRVIELEFLKNGELISDHLCYLANRVTYEYQKEKIIETLYSFDQPLLATDCEMWYKTIYHLDSENYIKKVEYFSKYDFTNVDSTEISKWKIWAPPYRVQTPDSTQLQIDYYYHSYSKMNWIYPVSRNFKLTEDYYYGDEPEKSSIKKGIER